MLHAVDGDSSGQQGHVANWLREELPFMLREQPWLRATLIAQGPSRMAHDPDTELVVAPTDQPLVRQPPFGILLVKRGGREAATA